MSGVDILMITYRWPSYVRQTLPRLLETCGDDMRVWIWHNGDDAETLEVSRSFERHPRVAGFHHSPVNERLRAPTNWLWEHATGDYLSKVDDDCLVSDGWAHTLRDAHESEPRFGILGSWRFEEEDFVREVAERKIARYAGGHRVMRNPWVQGSAYLMKRRCVDELGPLQEGQSFSSYGIEVAARGYVNGWYVPFVREEHLDDPRAPHTGLVTEADFQDRLPLSARWRGITTFEQWDEENRRSAYSVQAAHPDPHRHRGWRRRARLARRWVGQRLDRSDQPSVQYSGSLIPRMPGVPSWEASQDLERGREFTEFDDDADRRETERRLDD